MCLAGPEACVKCNEDCVSCCNVALVQWYAQALSLHLDTLSGPAAFLISIPRKVALSWWRSNERGPCWAGGAAFVVCVNIDIY